MIGGPSGNAGFVNGFIANTGNGTTLPWQCPSNGLRISDSSNVTVQNLGVFNIYTRTSHSDLITWLGTFRDLSSFVCYANGGTGMSNVTFNNCLANDSYCGFFTQYEASSSTYRLENCTAYNCNWGGICGDYNSSSTLDVVTVRSCWFHDFSNWDSGSGNYHHDGFFAWAVSGGTLTTWNAYNNLIGPNFGTWTAGGLFAQGWVANANVYNNILVGNASSYPDDGYIYINPYPDIVGQYNVFNNTVNGGGAGIGIYLGADPVGGHTTFVAQNYVAQNNLINNVGTPIARFQANSPSTTSANYNLGYGLNPSLQYSYSTTNSSVFKTFSQWQGLGFDANGSNGNPGLVGLGYPSSGGAAMGLGTNLYSSVQSDFFGYPCPATGNWTAGAVQNPPCGTLTASTLDVI